MVVVDGELFSGHFSVISCQFGFFVFQRERGLSTTPLCAFSPPEEEEDAGC